VRERGVLGEQVEVRVVEVVCGVAEGVHFELGQ